MSTRLSALARLCRQARALAAPHLAVVLALAVPGMVQADTCPTRTWPLWQDYAQRFVQADGRMLGSSMDPNQSSSEGQSYGMFFALVANDPESFERLWRWTRDNLAGSDPAHNLPGWLWGARPDGTWGILDQNSASDADLWFAFALLEADRLWHKPDYRNAARQLLANVEKTLVKPIPGLGRMLLPGPVGFEHPDQLWRFNASYLPLPLLRRFTREGPGGPWREVAENTLAMVADKDMNRYGFVPDWVAYRATDLDRGLFVVDPFSNQVGSYDAIRVYLWAGLTPASDPLAAKLLQHLDGMARATASSGTPPEKVEVLSGRTEGLGPYGFSAALVPYFRAKGQPLLAEQQQRIVDQAIANYRDPANPAHQQHQYYHLMLSLFSLGFSEKRYHFNQDGTLGLPWEAACASQG